VRVEILIAGVGGLGIVFAGSVLARAAAIYEGFEVTFSPSYGAEARGTACKSEVIISDERILYPRVRNCDFMISMSDDAVLRYIRFLKKDGYLVLDEDLVKLDVKRKGIKVVRVPAHRKAQEVLGTPQVTNMVMLGVLAKLLPLVSFESIKRSIKDLSPKRLVDLNVKALELGNRIPLGD